MSPFTILEPQNPWIDGYHVVQERRGTDFKAVNLALSSRPANTALLFIF